MRPAPRIRATFLPKPAAAFARLQTLGTGLVLARGEEDAPEPLARKAAGKEAGRSLSLHAVCV